MHRYLIAVGSNRCHASYGTPRGVVAAAIVRLDLKILAVSAVCETPPMGPSRRRYANAAIVAETVLDPPALLSRLKAIERAFGRRSGRRWGDRVIDLDIILWSGGLWASKTLAIPHRSFRDRAFVLDPANQIAAAWRDPLSGLTLRHLKSRLDRRRVQS